jgi:hypothetical protein
MVGASGDAALHGQNTAGAGMISQRGGVKKKDDDNKEQKKAFVQALILAASASDTSKLA